MLPAFLTVSDMSRFAWAVFWAGSLVCPTIALCYIWFRVEARREQLFSLFGLPGIVERYLQAKGRKTTAVAQADPAHRKRVADDFKNVFSKEFGREYGRLYYFVSAALAALATAFVVYILVREAFGPQLSGVRIPTPLQFALLGGYLWVASALIRGFVKTDISPATFYWIVFRHVLATCVGLIAADLVDDAGGKTNFLAFAVATFPAGDVVKMIRARVSKWIPSVAASVQGHPLLEHLQGMPQDTLDRMQELGIATTGELAQIDPLGILFETNLPPKVVIDLIDQAFLYNYIGDKVKDLRVRGIRGAIELASLREDPSAPATVDPALIASLAGVLGITEPELKNLIENLYQDNQVRLVWEIWGGFEQ